MQVAQTWRERTGMERVPEWDVLIEKLSPLAYNDEQLYLAAETAVDTYKDIRFTSDHMGSAGRCRHPAHESADSCRIYEKHPALDLG